MKRTMIIVWKWEDLDQEPIEMDPGFPVRGTKKDKIVRLNAPKSEKAIEYLLSLIAQIATQSAVLVFLHKEHGYNEEDAKRLQRPAPETVKFILFGGGDDYIYFAPHEAGLLDDFGGFMDEPEFEFTRTRPDGRKYSTLGEATVLVENSQSGRQEVNPYYFNKVWEYYDQDFLRTIYHLKHNLLNILFPNYLNAKEKNLSIRRLLSSSYEDQLKEVELFCNQLEQKERDGDSGTDDHSAELYRRLRAVLQQKILEDTPSKNDLKDLELIRNSFDALLQANAE